MKRYTIKVDFRSLDWDVVEDSEGEWYLAQDVQQTIKTMQGMIDYLQEETAAAHAVRCRCDLY